MTQINERLARKSRMLHLMRGAYAEAARQSARGDVVAVAQALRTADELDTAPRGRATTPSGRLALPSTARHLWFAAVAEGGAR